MSKPISRLWLLGPPGAILLSVFVYYARFASVRQWMDTKFPWVAENVGSRLPPLVVQIPAEPDAVRATPATGDPAPESPASTAPPVGPWFLTPEGRVDLPKLAADRNAWPKTVTLKGAREFPAVVNGKVVGKVEVPTGSEARLVSIQNGKLGVEYQGGGAWLSVEETDLAMRLRRP